MSKEIFFSHDNNSFDFYKTPSVPYQISFQEPATPVMNGLLDLHDYVFFFLIIIVSVVLVLLIQVTYTFSVSTRKPIFFSFSPSSKIYFFNILDIFRVLLSLFLSFFIFMFYFLTNIFKTYSADFFKLSVKLFADLSPNSFCKKPFSNVYNIHLNKNLEHTKKDLIAKASFSFLNFDYLSLIKSDIDYSSLNLNNLYSDSNFSLQDKIYTPINNIIANSDFNEFNAFTQTDYLNNLDFIFFFDSEKSLIILDDVSLYTELDYEVISDQDYLEDELAKVVLDNIIVQIFSSKPFMKFDFFYQIYSSIFFPKIVSKNSQSDLDSILAQALNNIFLNNVLSSKTISLQRSLKIGYFNHSTKLEIVWTLIPIFIIGLIITPSFFFMYAIDEDMESVLTIRVIGHQWFWSYVYALPTYTYDISNNVQEMSNYLTNTTIDLNVPTERQYLAFDSYMLDNMNDGSPRLLATDAVLILPKFSHINCIITSTDVIHSWAVPSFGVKVDAVPGRLNRADVFAEHEGMFFGQCSELCGVNHSFMPIHIQVVSLSDFLKFIFGV